MAKRSAICCLLAGLFELLFEDKSDNNSGNFVAIGLFSLCKKVGNVDSDLSEISSFVAFAFSILSELLLFGGELSPFVYLAIVSPIFDSASEFESNEVKSEERSISRFSSLLSIRVFTSEILQKL